MDRVGLSNGHLFLTALESTKFKLVSAESPLADLRKHWCLLTFVLFVKTESPDVLPGSF